MNDNTIKEDFPYEDIINLPHPVSSRHPQMPLRSRAAQFAPFAALTGHNEAIAETARRTTPRLDISADKLTELSRKLAYTLSFANKPEIEITYFCPDRCKTGGSYLTVKGKIKKVEEVFNLITLTDGTGIPLDAVSEISGEIFDSLDWQ